MSRCDSRVGHAWTQQSVITRVTRTRYTRPVPSRPEGGTGGWESFMSVTRARSTISDLIPNAAIDTNPVPSVIFAARMRALRQMHGLSQDNVARGIETRLGQRFPQTAVSKVEAVGRRLDPTAVTRMENGNRRISLDEAVAIAGFFQRPLDDLLCRDCLARDLEFLARVSAAPAHGHHHGQRPLVRSAP